MDKGKVKVKGKKKKESKLNKNNNAGVILLSFEDEANTMVMDMGAEPIAISSYDELLGKILKKAIGP